MNNNINMNNINMNNNNNKKDAKTAYRPYGYAIGKKQLRKYLHAVRVPALLFPNNLKHYPSASQTYFAHNAIFRINCR